MATHSSVLAWRIQGRGSLVGCCLWGHTELDTTEVTYQQPQQQAFLSITNSRSSLKLMSIDREGNGNPLQYSCLENPMDGGAW